MVQKKFKVLLIEYSNEDEKSVKNLVEGVTRSMDSIGGKTKLVYDGVDKRIVAALESVLKLTE